MLNCCLRFKRIAELATDPVKTPTAPRAIRFVVCSLVTSPSTYACCPPCSQMTIVIAPALRDRSWLEASAPVLVSEKVTSKECRGPALQAPVGKSRSLGHDWTVAMMGITQRQKDSRQRTRRDGLSHAVRAGKRQAQPSISIKQNEGWTERVKARKRDAKFLPADDCMLC